jgi:toxin ParE1/3/4
LKPFLIHAEAEAEILTAVAHYETQLENLGGDFRRELEAVLERIQSSPQTFKAIDDQGTRKVRLRRFPYAIYYLELDDSLWIAAVAHQKRRPGYWSHRRVEIEGTG